MSRSALTGSILCAIALFSPAPARPESASALCVGLSALVRLAGANFAEPGSPQPLSGAERCAMARAISGENTYHCQWSFPFREASAQAAFTAFDQEIGRCFGVSAEAFEDQGVNHPDSYDLRRYRLEGAVVTLSLKDKAELRKTFVFVGVRGPDRAGR